MLKVYDISFDPQFFKDMEKVPESVQGRFEDRISYMLDRIKDKGWSEIPNLFNSHKIEGTEIWIGHLTNGGKAWRVLFEIDAVDTIRFWRIMTHNHMDVYIRNLQYVLDN